jgi:hypothetical protein
MPAGTPFWPIFTHRGVAPDPNMTNYRARRLQASSTAMDTRNSEPDRF